MVWDQDAAGSNPVAPTILYNDLQRDPQSALSANLSHQALNALADAAKAVANALGQGSFAPASFSPPIQTGLVTVAEAVNEFLKVKARAGRSDRYLRQLRVSLNSFARGRMQTDLDAVTLLDLESWLDAQGWAAKTQRGYLCDVRTLFNFAVRRGLARHNPANAVELPAFVEALPSIHTPAQVCAVLNFAREFDPVVCRALAIRYFAGLRSSEAHRLIEAEIGRDYVEVTAAKSKTRRRRLVTIQPALRAWLDLGGVLPLTCESNRMRYFNAALLKAEGFNMSHNVTRHSFVSYHLAEFGNAGKTAMQAGHTEQILFSNYRELVTPESAKEFWAIYPHAVAPATLETSL